MNGLGSVVGNNKYKAMMQGLFPVTFTSIAYLARAIILYPEVIQSMCDFGRVSVGTEGDKEGGDQNDDQGNNNDGDDDKNNDDTTNQNQKPKSTADKLQFLVDMYFEPEGGVWSTITSFVGQ